jgi:phosphate transport system protein
MEIRTGKDVSRIREKIIAMARLAETSVTNAVDSFLSLDPALAESVISGDSEINSIEMEIDRDTVACLVLNAPKAGDFRLLFCMQKMNKDLERIGDHAVNIAEATVTCARLSSSFDQGNAEVMATHATGMLHDAIECFKTSDAGLALRVLKRDDQVDELNRLISRQVLETVRRDAASAEALLELLRVSKNLERIADLSTNIAEDVIFYIKALDVKHHHIDE